MHRAFTNPERQLEMLLEEIHCAPCLTRDLFVKVMQEGCPRLWHLNGRRRAHLSRLVKDEAWVDAALVLIQLNSPQWKLRRLQLDDGECFCSLSKCPAIPLELDDMADARHEDAALAILAAFLEAERKAVAEPYTNEGNAPCRQMTTLLDCENFG